MKRDVLQFIKVIILCFSVMAMVSVMAQETTPPPDKKATLFTAAGEGNLEVVKEIIQQEPALLEARNPRGTTPIGVAASRGRDEVVRWLGDQGAHVNAANAYGNTPLHYAGWAASPGSFEFLIEKGANLLTINSTGSTPVQYAAMGGSLDIMRLLEDQGVDFKMRDRDGATLLHWAANGGHTDVFDFLVAKGLDINARDKEEVPIVFWAVSTGSVGMIDHLMQKYHVDILAKARDGGTLLSTAIVYDKLEVVDFLIRHGADVNATTDDGLTPAHLACMRGSRAILERLVQAGANLNVADTLGRTPLHMVMHSDSTGCLEMLCNSGINLNQTTHSGETPVMLAIGSRKESHIRNLAKHGARFDMADKQGMTPLHLAAQSGNLSIAEFILSTGADVNLKDLSGHTPIYYANYYGNKEVCDALLKHGADKHYMAVDPVSEHLSSLKEGEAVIWYLNHSGYAIKTRNRLLVFDFFQFDQPPTTPSINNGWFDPEAWKDEEVWFFVSHGHQDHFDHRILEWKERLPKSHYIFGFPDSLNQAGAAHVKPNNQEMVGDLKITTIKSNDTGEGFIVEVDGLTIFHPGDHANKNDEMTPDYQKELDFLSGKYKQLDIAFFPVSGCSFNNKKAVYAGAFYAMDKLHPQMVFPMHGGNHESDYQDFAAASKKKFPGIRYGVPKYKGDRYFYGKEEKVAR